MKILEKEVVDYKGIQIIGVDYQENKNDIVEILSELKINKTKHSILLYHMPTKLRYLQQEEIDLQLSGHTHKGQIFPFNFLVRLANPYLSRLYQEGKAKIYVSPGTGTWALNETGQQE